MMSMVKVKVTVAVMSIIAAMEQREPCVRAYVRSFVSRLAYYSFVHLG